MVFEPILTAFTGGELSKRLRGRVDAEVYKRGLSECLNWEPMPQGSLRMRAGPQFIRDLAADGADESVRLLQFRMADEQDFLAALMDRTMRIYALDGSNVTAQFLSASEQLTNGDFSGGSAGWTTYPTGDTALVFSLGKVRVSTSLLAGARVLQQSVVIASLTDLALSFHPDNYLAPSTSITVKLGTSDGAGDIYTYTGRPAAAVRTTIAGVAAGTVYLSIWLARNSVSTNNLAFDLDDVSLSIESADSDSVIVTPWSADEVADVQVVVETGVDRMVLVHPRVPPYYLQRDATGAWAFGRISFSGQPVEWTGDTWPGVCELYQGRLWLSGVPGQSNRLWGSRTGSIFDFTLETNIAGTDTVLPTDGIDVKLASKGAMRWMQSGRNFLMGTDMGEHSFQAQSGVLGPTDLQARDESAFGSCAIQAVHAGTMALYVSADRRKVRALSYDLQTSGWDSRDLTFVSEHITLGLVEELHQARDPNGTIVALLRDGTLALCTFAPGEQVMAWWRLETGLIRSLAVSHGPDGSFLWMAVSRGTQLLLERLPMAEEGAVYLDSWTTTTLTPGQLVVTGLDHLEGQTVGVILDGFLEPDAVVSGGSVTLARTGAEVTIGLRYTATATTMEIEGGNPRGTALANRRRWVSAVLRINESALPLVNGERALERSATTAFDTPEALVDGFVEARTLGWEENGAVTISQDLPFRTEVLAVFGTVASSGV